MEKPSLESLDKDLKRLKKAINPPPKRTSQASYAFRVGTELFSGVAVGLAVGYGLDSVFGTRPWLTFIFCIFGFIAGMKLMIETARQAGANMEEEEQNHDGES